MEVDSQERVVPSKSPVAKDRQRSDRGWRSCLGDIGDHHQNSNLRRFLMTRPRQIPWREVVLVNGILSCLIGLAALIAVRRFGPQADNWVRNNSPELVGEAVEVIVLSYIAYAIGLIVIALLMFFVPVWIGRGTDKLSTTASAATSQG
jgi:uncharacterized membrane protein